MIQLRSRFGQPPTVFKFLLAKFVFAGGASHPGVAAILHVDASPPAVAGRYRRIVETFRPLGIEPWPLGDADCPIVTIAPILDCAVQLRVHQFDFHGDRNPLGVDATDQLRVANALARSLRRWAVARAVVPAGDPPMVDEKARGGVEGLVALGRAEQLEFIDAQTQYVAVTSEASLVLFPLTSTGTE